MTKADLKILEKAFACQIEGRAFQSKSKRVKALAEAGYLQFVQHRDRSQALVLTWEEYVLTVKGNFTYCMSCTDEGGA